MSFGEHLDELRQTLIWALAGVVVGTVICLAIGRHILAVLFQPLLIVQSYNGLPMELQALAPAAAFLAYLKIGFMSGLLLSMPWVLYQAWRFIASGLYPQERRFVRNLVPVSLLLFVLGVLFLYFIVLPIVLHFFISFNKQFAPPEVKNDGFYSWLLPEKEEVESDVLPTPLEIPILEEDPKELTVDAVWFNGQQRKLKVAADGKVWSVAMRKDDQYSSVQSMFAIDFYISFVLSLALAFGIAFELPVVVYFLARSGIVPVSVMARGRRYVLFGIVVIAALMTPPDVISQLLLAGPMYLLFELGLFIGRGKKRKQQRPTA